ncbi:MAG: glycosyltransferase family 4 protein [Fervidobacterium sp.]|nr:glycosyltransferase family 4 protein [Fervidobacterium sp.]
MRIVHVCLTGPYTDGLGYQENLLTKYHKKLGHEVIIIANDCRWSKSGKIECSSLEETYINENGIPVYRLTPVFGAFGRRLGLYHGFLKLLRELDPDVVFFHGPQSLALLKVVKYKKRHKSEVVLLVDSHADFWTSARNFISKNILHKGLWRIVVKTVEPYVEKFYCVAPQCCDFLRQVYRIADSRIELLVMGADDEKIILDQDKRGKIRKQIREKLKIKESEFLIITGGKIDKQKRQTLSLMKVVRNFREAPLKMVIFGTIAEELSEEFMSLLDADKIIYLGWLSQEQIYEYLIASDLAVYPGRFSVLWQHTVALGIPSVFKYFPGQEYLDLGGNCLFLYDDSEEEMYKVLKRVVTDETLYGRMKEVALKEGHKVFTYGEIAKKFLEPVKATSVIHSAKQW